MKKQKDEDGHLKLSAGSEVNVLKSMLVIKNGKLVTIRVRAVIVLADMGHRLDWDHRSETDGFVAMQFSDTGLYFFCPLIIL